MLEENRIRIYADQGGGYHLSSLSGSRIAAGFVTY